MADATGLSNPPDPATHAAGGRSCSRRGLLIGAMAGATGLAAGAALGYKFRSQIKHWRDALASSAGGNQAARISEDPREEYVERAREIHRLHRQQTAQTVAALKEKYEHPVFGKVLVWDLIEKLAQCIDVSDQKFCGASQYLHVQQALAAMEDQGIDDPHMFLIALVHDLGKVFLLAGEVPENVLCTTSRIGEAEPGAGLDNVVYQFGHGELIYSRIKDHVPEPIAWTARYHNINANDAAPYMNERDRTYTEQYLKPFRFFDTTFTSPYWIPKIDMSRFKDLVHQYFPRPILF
jgi:hypothetical protein